MAKNQFGFYFNQDNCIGCRACEGACKQQWQADVGVRYRKVHIFEGGQYPAPITNYLSLSCNHCENPACVEVCPAKRIIKRKDGLVIYNDISVNADGTLNYDNITCIFCGNCETACPYKVPQPNEKPTKGNKKRYEKCIGCYPRIDAKQKPACAQTCLGLALESGTVEEHEKKGAVKDIVGFEDPSLTNPTTRFFPARKTSKQLKEVTNR